MTLQDLFAAADDGDVAAAAAGPQWVVLADTRSGRRGLPEPSLRRALVQLGAAAVVVLVLVVLAGGLVSRRIAESQSVHEVAQLTDVLATSVVQPALTDAVAGPTARATRTIARLDALVRTRVLSDSLIRVKLWTPSGTIAYSDERRLIGVRFPLDPDARAAFSAPQVRAQISDLSAPENRYERGRGSLLEVYRPVWTPDGSPLLFETYFRYNQVSDRAGQLWRGFAGITVSSVAAVVVLLIPLVWTLVARARRAHRQREQMLQRAMDASLDERRRIAATLHDGIVQELVAASFAVAGGAGDARSRGEPELADRLQAAGDAVRASIVGMRSLLVDIYPPNLRTAGLAPALRDLAASVRAPVDLDIDEHAAEHLTAPEQEAVFRITQECLRNAVNHADAATVHVRLQHYDDGVELTVADDGVGFDPAEGRHGHFGTTLMTDVARENSAELALLTAPGQGTQWRLRLPYTSEPEQSR